MRAKFSLCMVAALGALACGTSGPRQAQTVDCSPESELSALAAKGAYKSWHTFDDETAGQSTPESAFDTQDSTAGATHSHNVMVIPDGPRCGVSKQALELKAEGYNDWGITFPLSLANFAAYDATGFDGIALWMRATDATRSFILTLADKQSFAAGMECQNLPDGGSDAVSPETLPSWVPLNLRCSEFERITEVTDTWTLYKIPFTSFAQPLNAANRYQPIDPSGLYILGFRIPKAAHLDLWIDDVGFYKSQ